MFELSNEHRKGIERDLSQERRAERAPEKSVVPLSKMPEKALNAALLLGALIHSAGKGDSSLSAAKGNGRLQVGLRQSGEHTERMDARIEVKAPPTRVQDFIHPNDIEGLSAATRKSAADATMAVAGRGKKNTARSGKVFNGATPASPMETPVNAGTMKLRAAMQPASSAKLI